MHDYVRDMSIGYLMQQVRPRNLVWKHNKFSVARYFSFLDALKNGSSVHLWYNNRDKFIHKNPILKP